MFVMSFCLLRFSNRSVIHVNAIKKNRLKKSEINGNVWLHVSEDRETREELMKRQ